MYSLTVQPALDVEFPMPKIKNCITKITYNVQYESICSSS